MKTSLGTILIIISCVAPTIAQTKLIEKNKRLAIDQIEDRVPDLIMWSNLIWEYAELSLKEEKSAALIKDILRQEGFTIQENVSGFNTVFIATYGVEKPIVGLFGEYDADEGASNKVVPHKEEFISGAPGHGGHHNLLGVGSLGAALTIKNLIKEKRLKCTIRYYGTSAEGSIGTKSFLAREGYFNDLDISLYWHPSPVTAASTSPWDALFDLEVTFSGKEVNSLGESPQLENTLSASESLIKTLHELRLQIDSGKKINYFLKQKMVGLNNIADTARFMIRIQTARQEEAVAALETIKEAVKKIQTETRVHGKIQVTAAKHQFVPNVSAMRMVYKNMTALEPEVYSDHEQEFVRELQQFLNMKDDGIQNETAPFVDQSKRETVYGFASDIGDASWIAPEIYFSVQTLPPVTMHQWPGTIFSGHTIGHKGMIRAAKILSMTIIEYVLDKNLQKAIRHDFELNTKQYSYKSYLSRDSD